MRRIISMLLITGMVAAIALMGATATSAALDGEKIAEIHALVQEYNQTHGGVGELKVTVYPDSEINGHDIYVCHITGEIRGATKGIVFLEDCGVFWAATLTGTNNGEAMVASPYRVVVSGTIETTGIAVESPSIYVYLPSAYLPGEISYVMGDLIVRDFGNDNDLSFDMDGGVVDGDLLAETADMVRMRGGTINGSIFVSELVMEGNATINATQFVSPYTHLQGNARLNLLLAKTVRTRIIKVESPAMINAERKLNNCILVTSQPIDYVMVSDDECILEKETWTVIGNVDLGATLRLDKTTSCLVVPQGMKLTVTNLYAECGKIVVDGELVIIGNKIIGSDVKVTGRNAQALLSDETPDPSPEDEQNHWWEAYPSLIQWILRWLCFGWLWMN